MTRPPIRLPKRLTGDQILRRVRREIKIWIDQIGLQRAPDDRQRGHLEALRHIDTFIRNQQ
jgi:hypothetical protein